MAGVWSYEGKRVLVSGGGGAGMGAAAVRDLIELGAEVHVFDVKEPSSEVASYRSVDLRDPAAIEAAVADLGGPLDALFNCAGLPGPPFSGLDTMLVNFVAARHLTGLAAAHMDSGAAVCTISSAGAFGWENTMGQVADLIATPGYAEARQWCEDHAAAVGEGYLLSKQAIIVWTLHAALDLAPRGIRVNCTSPGPTQTPMMPSFESYMGKDFMDRFPKPLGRPQLHARGAGPPRGVPEQRRGHLHHRHQRLRRRRLLGRHAHRRGSTSRCSVGETPAG